MISGTAERRRTVLICTRFQVKLLCLTVMIMVGAFLVTAWTVYSNILTETAGTDPVNLNRTVWSTMQTLAFRMGFLLVLAAVACIFLTHRVTGPARRLEQVIKSIGHGPLPDRVNLRKGDEFEEVAAAMNGMLKRLRVTSAGTEAMPPEELLGNCSYIEDLLVQAEALKAAGKYDEAECLLDQAAAGNTRIADINRMRSKLYFCRAFYLRPDNLDGKITWYRAAVKAWPENKLARENLCEIYLKLAKEGSNTFEKQMWYRSALQVSPACLEAHLAIHKT